MKYTNRSINTIVSKGKKTITYVNIGGERAGDGFATPNRPHRAIENLILNLRKMDTSSFRSRNGVSRSKMIKTFETERAAAEEELWSMYSVIQKLEYSNKMHDESDRNMLTGFSSSDLDHLVHSNNESISCGTFYRSSEAHVKPVTKIQVPCQSVPHPTPRSESRAVYKMCSKIDNVNGGRQVLGYGNTNTKQWEDS